MDGVPEVLSKPHQWSAFRTDAFGYTIMNVVNNTHVYIKQLDVNNVLLFLPLKQFIINHFDLHEA